MADVGRPTKLTEENILELEKRFRDGATTLEAIDGIFSEATYYLHLKDNIEFSERMELAKEYTTEIARSVVSRAIKRGDRDSAKWWLERRAKAKFSTRSELTGADGKDLPAPILGGVAKDVPSDTGNTQASKT
jgi:hypothetical protein